MRSLFTVLLTVLAATSFSAHAENKSAFVNCKESGSARPALLSGYLDLVARKFSYIDVGSGKPMLITNGLFSGVDERCGELTLPLKSTYSFEVTGSHAWGEDVLELPIASILNNGSVAFSANLHTCSFDGDWSTYSDTALECELSAFGD